MERRRTFEVEKSSSFKYTYRKMETAEKRKVDRGVDTVMLGPTDPDNPDITALSKRTNSQAYRFRMPGMWLFYSVHDKKPIITFTQIRQLKKM